MAREATISNGTQRDPFLPPPVEAAGPVQEKRERPVDELEVMGHLGKWLDRLPTQAEKVRCVRWLADKYIPATVPNKYIPATVPN